MHISKKILFSVLICVGFIANANADYIEKFSLPYFLDALTDSQIKECESIYNDFITLSDFDFYTRYQTHQFTGNCVMLYEDSLWDYDGSDRYEKLSERSAELIQERETEQEQRRENFSITSQSLTELQIPGTFLFSFKGCTGDQSIELGEVVVESDREVVKLAKNRELQRVVPPGVCNIIEIQIRADDPSSIRVLIPSLEVDVETKIEEQSKIPLPGIQEQIEPSLPSRVMILTGDLSHKAKPLTEKDFNECERINQDYQNLDENIFNTRYLYHGFVGDCVLLYQDSVWETIESSTIDELNQRVDDLRNQKDDLRKGEFQQFSITPQFIEPLSEGVYLFSFEGCTRDEFVNVDNAVVASDVEVISIVSPKREGNIVPPGVCVVYKIKIRADDPNSVKVVFPMMPQEGMMEDKDTASVKQMSPRAQIKSGIALNEISCKTGFELILKSSDNSPACVKELHVEKLIQRGWGKLA